MSKRQAIIVSGDYLNLDYCHALSTHASKCKALHGHSSRIEVIYVGRKLSEAETRNEAELYHPDMVIDFYDAKRLAKLATELFDHKMIVNRLMIQSTTTERGNNQKDADYITFGWLTSNGQHTCMLPRSECFVIDCDSTIENLSQYLSDFIKSKCPDTVDQVIVRMHEGIAKQAISGIEQETDVYAVMRLFDDHAVNCN